MNITTRYDHTSRDVARKLTPHERHLLATLYVRLQRNEKQLQRVASRHGERV